MKKAVAMALGTVICVLGVTPTASAETGNQRFKLVFRGEQSTVVASGPITGAGTVVDQEGGNETSFPVAFVFPDGTVFLTVTTVDESFDFDTTTCIGRLNLVEHFEITGGTDRYRGASGTGTFVGRAIVIFPRDSEGNCLRPESGVEPTFSFSVLTGTGDVAVPYSRVA